MSDAEHEQGSQSVLSNASAKAENDNDNFKDDSVEHNGYIEMPKKSAGAYATISILCCMIGFGGFIAGWDTGTIGGFMGHPDFMRRFGQKRRDGTHYFSNSRTGLIVSIFNLGGCIGCLTLNNLAGRVGRKKALVIVVIIYMVGIVIEMASINKWYQYFIGRIISGMGVGAISIFSPMLLSEVSPKHLRGTLGSVYQLMVTFGIFLGDCTNSVSYTHLDVYKRQALTSFAISVQMEEFAISDMLNRELSISQMEFSTVMLSMIS